TISLGQGANMALPVWALFMQKVYNDPILRIKQGDFEKPQSDIAIEFDCDAYERRLQEEQRNNNSLFDDDF
ncbi:hypothetical protein RZS08_63100, partial [Arthrospira platensis SPKY1]|nr:hypothetical protein [Arthrospira platensis SPKY1]